MKMKSKRVAGIKEAVCWVCVVTVLLCSACGNKENSDKIDDSLSDVMAGLYEQADLSEDFRAGMVSFETYEMTEDIEISILGTDEIEYTEGVVSMPRMSSVAYQCVLLRVDEDTVDTVKQQLKDNADLNKWVCVSAETMLIESRGDVILSVMGDQDTVYALNEAFQKY